MEVRASRDLFRAAVPRCDIATLLSLGGSRSLSLSVSRTRELSRNHHSTGSYSQTTGAISELDE